MSSAEHKEAQQKEAKNAEDSSIAMLSAKWGKELIISFSANPWDMAEGGFNKKSILGFRNIFF